MQALQITRLDPFWSDREDLASLPSVQIKCKSDVGIKVWLFKCIAVFTCIKGDKIKCLWLF